MADFDFDAPAPQDKTVEMPISKSEDRASGFTSTPHKGYQGVPQNAAGRQNLGGITAPPGYSPLHVESHSGTTQVNVHPPTRADPPEQARTAPPIAFGHPSPHDPEEEKLNTGSYSFSGISEPKTINMSDPVISKSFSLGQRTKMFFKRCCCACLEKSRSYSTVERMMRATAPFEATGEKYVDNCLKLKVVGTGTLRSDQFMTHPFVRVHFIDIETAKYLAKTHSDPSEPSEVVENKEKCGVISSTKDILSVGCDFVLPLGTCNCDLRVRGESRALFDESFVLNIPPTKVLKSTTVAIFELLDYSLALLREPKTQLKLTQDNLYPIAWGYLRLVGESNIHLGPKRIQLYEYLFNSKSDSALTISAKSNIADFRTPQVFYDFNWPFHTPYPSYLDIQLTLVPKMDPYRVIDKSLYAWEYEVGKRTFQELLNEAGDRKAKKRADQLDRY